MLLLLAATTFTFTTSALAANTSYADTCKQIASSISKSSGVYYPSQPQYDQGIVHNMISSEQAAACVVEPGTAQDLGQILRIVGSSRTPASVKGGGHGSNPGCSSTTGVQIFMSRFGNVTYDANAQTATIGAGLTWSDVYKALVPQGVNVVGGRQTTVGVSGLTLGGGYSWLTNEHGLTVDTLVSLELVKPDGTVATVTESSDPDLFFALKGGMNNYGVVTRITLKTFPQGLVWGGLTVYVENLDQVASAVANFHANNRDPKASIIAGTDAIDGLPVVTVLLFYNGPNPPHGLYDDFLKIETIMSDVKTRDFISLSEFQSSVSASYPEVVHQRGIFNTAPVRKVDINVINAIFNESKFWAQNLTPKSATFLTYEIEYFLPNYLSFTKSPSAWPFTRKEAFQPQFIWFAWSDATYDQDFYSAARQSAQQIRRAAMDEGQQGIDSAPIYPNYAIFDTPVEKIYGSSLDRMRKVKARVDPQNVMGLFGGFKV